MRRIGDYQNSNLDVLRAIAVLTVLIAHTSLILTKARFGERFAFGLDMYILGQFGVLLFFVHTALVLMRSMERMKLAGNGLIRRFYIRRAFRIYPLSLLLVLSVATFSIPPSASPPSTYSWQGWNWFIANLLLMQNLLRASSISSASISGPLWSLPFEVQMYLVLPAIFLWLRGKSFGRLLVLYVGGLLLSYMHVLLMFIPCFLAGVVAYKVSQVMRPRLPSWLWLPFLLALLIVRLLRPGIYTIAEATLFVGLMIPLFRTMPSGLLVSSAARVAKYSYGIYLWHTPLLWLFYEHLNVPVWERLTGFVLGVCLLPVLSYHVVEEPLIQFGKRLAADRREARLPILAASS